MSDLRERAAIAAMQELIWDRAHEMTPGPVITAQHAVEYADALLAELERTKPKPKVDPASYRAGLEAAAHVVDLARSATWVDLEGQRLVAHIADAIRALPTPSTLSPTELY